MVKLLFIQDFIPRGWRPGPPGLGCPDLGTKLEVELLQETLFKNFGLTSRLEEKSKDQWILYIQVKQDVKNKLLNLVRPYMHNSIMYKV
jgi:hypothetical protein